MAKKVEDCNWETIFYVHYRSAFNHCDVIGQEKIKFGKKIKIKAITPLKVIEVGINRKPVCNFLLVINSN